MKVYQIVFTFLDPSRAMGTIMADTPEEAVEKLKADIEANSPGIENLKIESVEEIVSSDTPQSDVSDDRTLN